MCIWRYVAGSRCMKKYHWISACQFLCWSVLSQSASSLEYVFELFCLLTLFSSHEWWLWFTLSVLMCEDLFVREHGLEDLWQSKWKLLVGFFLDHGSNQRVATMEITPSNAAKVTTPSMDVLCHCVIVRGSALLIVELCLQCLQRWRARQKQA